MAQCVGVESTYRLSGAPEAADVTSVGSLSSRRLWRKESPRRRAELPLLDVSGKPGGLNGSTQQQFEVYLQEFRVFRRDAGMHCSLWRHTMHVEDPCRPCDKRLAVRAFILESPSVDALTVGDS